MCGCGCGGVLACVCARVMGVRVCVRRCRYHNIAKTDTLSGGQKQVNHINEMPQKKFR